VKTPRLARRTKAAVPSASTRSLRQSSTCPTLARPHFHLFGRHISPRRCDDVEAAAQTSGSVDPAEPLAEIIAPHMHPDAGPCAIVPIPARWR
jgi:hypothetical protein